MARTSCLTTADTTVNRSSPTLGVQGGWAPRASRGASGAARLTSAAQRSGPPAATISFGAPIACARFTIAPMQVCCTSGAALGAQPQRLQRPPPSRSAALALPQRLQHRHRPQPCRAAADDQPDDDRLLLVQAGVELPSQGQARSGSPAMAPGGACRAVGRACAQRQGRQQCPPPPPPPPPALPMAHAASPAHPLLHPLRNSQAAVVGVGDADYINRQLMEILAPKTDYLAVRPRMGWPPSAGCRRRRRQSAFVRHLQVQDMAAGPHACCQVIWLPWDHPARCHPCLPPHPPAAHLPPHPWQEFLAIQQQEPRSLGFFGTRNMGARRRRRSARMRQRCC